MRRETYKRIAVWAAVILLALLLESRLRMLGSGPNITVVLACYAGVRYGHLGGMGMGALLGVLGDAMAWGMIGPNMLAHATAGYLAAFTRGGVFIWTPLLGIISFMLITMVDGFISAGCTAVFTNHPVDFSNSMVTILLQAAFNALIGVFVRPQRND